MNFGITYFLKIFLEYRMTLYGMLPYVKLDNTKPFGASPNLSFLIFNCTKSMSGCFRIKHIRIGEEFALIFIENNNTATHSGN